MKLLKYIKIFRKRTNSRWLGRPKEGTDKSKGDVLVDKLWELNPVNTKTKTIQKFI
jgi:hypothetical protein